jgi:hypothetical protein
VIVTHDGRQDVVAHDLAGDDDLGDVVVAGDVEHHREEDFLHDRPQAASAGAALERLVGDRSTASSVNSSSTPSISNIRWYCLMRALRGSVRIARGRRGRAATRS